MQREPGGPGSTDPLPPRPPPAQDLEPGAQRRPTSLPSAPPLPRVSAHCVLCKPGALPPRESSQERSVTRGVWLTLSPPPTLGRADLEGPAGWQIRKVDGPRAGSGSTENSGRCPGGLSPTPAAGAQPWLGGTSFQGVPESLPDSHTVQLSWTRCVHWGAAAVQPQPLLGKGYG